MTNFINLTPHTIKLNDGRVFPASGNVARVTSSHSEIVEDVCTVIYGEVTGLPEPVANTKYIVSGMVLEAVKRDDVVAPASGHPAVVRENGQVVSVPCFRK